MESTSKKRDGHAEDEPRFFGDNDSFTQITNRLFSQGRYLTPQAKWLYSTLKSYWFEKTERIFPSYTSLEKRSGLTRPSISRALNELEHFGWILRKRNFSKSSDYVVSFPLLRSEIIEPHICPTKQEALQWKKVQAQKRLQSRKNRMQNKIWEEAKYKGEVDINEDDGIPF